MHGILAARGTTRRSVVMGVVVLMTLSTMALFATASASSAGHRPTITKASFGSLADGTPVDILPDWRGVVRTTSR